MNFSKNVNNFSQQFIVDFKNFHFISHWSDLEIGIELKIILNNLIFFKIEKCSLKIDQKIAFLAKNAKNLEEIVWVMLKNDYFMASY